jgi:hypothetical protein
MTNVPAATTLQASFTGADLPPFEGDRTVKLLALPADARVLSAMAVLRPDWPVGAEFRETVTADGFAASGVTVETGAGGVVVDFHARRRVLALGVSGAGTGTAQVYVDLGGVWSAVDDTGALARPGEKPNWTLAGGVLTVPGMQTPRLRLVSAAVTGVSSVSLSCFPGNVTLRLGNQGAFFVHLGDLAADARAPDFTAALAAFLPEIPVENGHRVLPITIHSDGLARLALCVELSYVQERSLLPPAVDGLELPFGYERTPLRDGGPVPMLGLAAGEAVAAGQARGRVVGRFDDSRIALGPDELMVVKGPQRIGDGYVQAQPIVIRDPLDVVGVDLRIQPLTDDAALSVTFLGDADGKPWGEPLLPEPMRAAVPRDPAGGYRWFGLSLPGSLSLAPGPAGAPSRCWLIATADAGSLNWATTAATPGAELYRSEDAWLTWQRAALARAPGPLTAAFRLRHRPDRFEMPIELIVGDGPRAEVRSLAAFSPAGQVDFSLGAVDELASAINGFVAATGLRECPEAEHLANGELTRFVTVDQVEFLSEWAVTGTAIAVPLSGGLPLTGVRVIPPKDGTGALSQVTAAAQGCPYVLEFLGLASGSGVEAQLIWRRESCGAERTDRLEVRIAPPDGAPASGDEQRPRLLHRLSVTAPDAADQVEVRFLVPSDAELTVGAVSLRASAELLANADLRGLDPVTTGAGDPAVTGWEISGSLLAADSGVVLRNSGTVEARAAQRVEVLPATPYTLELTGRALPPEDAAAPDEPEPEPRVELAFSDAVDAPLGDPVVHGIPLLAMDRHLIEVVSGASATTATLSLVLPPRAALALAAVSLRARPRQPVAVSFRAESPGSLVVQQASVGITSLPPVGAPVTADGYCPPTAPGEEPGPLPADRCHCGSCGSDTPLRRSAPARTEAGRPARLAACTHCHAPVLAVGGPPVPAAEALPPAHDVSIRFRRHAGLPVIVVDGVGPARSRELAGLGISTLAELAAASVGRLSLVSSLSSAGAGDIRREANRLLFAP